MCVDFVRFCANLMTSKIKSKFSQIRHTYNLTSDIRPLMFKVTRK
ncbi:hypothetical protein HMPREF1573_01015 [Gardnerella vaginalis JCP7276]|nr:hypothetical protein HMPREF1572_01245 [Gardnerella vaginalis JCP7275]EPI56116.1 hypothetical protein HMPREF1573_01015 [Gardnerella vaginalis JCP7276]